MCDEFIHPGLVTDARLSRRGFAAMTVAAASVAANPALAQSNVVEKDVQVKTVDGMCDAALFYPATKGTYAAVLMWPDIMGLRPAFRDMGKRLAAQGYVVLVPNPFYRSTKAPVIGDNFDFSNPEERAKLMGYRGAMTNDGIDHDAAAYLAFLDAQPQTAKNKKAGVQGYCMGGALSFRTAAVVPSRIGAVGSFHGGNGLVTDKSDSPHLLIAKTNSAYLICQAQNDDAQNPKMKDDLKAAFTAAGKTATVDVYPANHGWCVKGGAVYNEAEAERAWTALSQLYKTSLI
ncbi:MAG: dienelactone hydrolase family protein [Alphaproteobacteria bacterium]|nr:dienelactone hydrolase family protein [Alphaproteobacteria bacterium]